MTHHPVGRRDAEFIADIPNGRRETLRLDVTTDEVINGLLLGCHERLIVLHVPVLLRWGTVKGGRAAHNAHSANDRYLRLCSW